MAAFVGRKSTGSLGQMQMEDPSRYSSFQRLRVEEEEGGSSSSSSSSTSAEEQPEIFIHTTSNLGDVRETGIQRYSQLIEEALGLRIHEFALRLATVVWFLTGMYCVMYCGLAEERQDAISSMYLMVQLITTVGYGDIYPRSQGMKIFMGCYVLVGNVLTALVITERLQTIVNRSHNILKSHMVTNMVEGAQNLHGKTKEEENACRHQLPSKLGGLVTAFVTYMAFLLIGALYYSFMDNCLCPFGHLDCSTDTGCEEAGGRFRTFPESFYMASITLTTVGFGDEAPSSKWGRLFGIFWMLFGVASMANFLAEMAHFVLLKNMQFVAQHGMSHELFMKIDQDNSGSLTKFEFTTYMLVKYGLVSETDLDMLIEEFEAFDKDHSGELTYEEICGQSDAPPRRSRSRLTAPA